MRYFAAQVAAWGIGAVIWFFDALLGLVMRSPCVPDHAGCEEMSEDERWGRVGRIEGTDWFRDTEL